MARRVIIRSRELNTAVAQLEQMVANDYKTILKNHLEDLEQMAIDIVEDARALAPEDKGKLKDSIKARVSKSPRYPGLIVSASAKAKYTPSFDYALIQEENELFSHEKGQAGFLAQAFYNALSYFYQDVLGMVLPISYEELTND